jgi:5-methylthioribose kinase
VFFRISDFRFRIFLGKRYHFLMLELTAANALDYLRFRGWIGPGPARVEGLGWGVSNAVLRVETPEQLFVLKQSRPQLRTRDAWFSDLGRVYREQEVMQFLHPLLPVPTVPDVLHVDRDNYVFAMSHAPREARVWKEALLAGEVDLAVAKRAGSILGLMHEAAAARAADLEAFRDATVFVQLRVDPYYRRVQERRPEVARPVGQIVEQMLATKESLCHGDYSPKNILIHARGFTLVDYETAHFGDPTMDLGFFLSHLILKAIKNRRQHRSYFDLTRAFWQSYLSAISFRPAHELQARGISHFGVCVLARIDGTSPVEYLTDEPGRETARRLGRKILLDHPATWDEALAVCESEIKAV